MHNGRLEFVLPAALLPATVLTFPQHDVQRTGQLTGAGYEDPVTPVLLGLTIILVAAKIGGELFERMKQPAVLGELIAGVILGNIILLIPGWTFFEPLRDERITEHWAIVIDAITRVGVILLLFEIGLESIVSEMKKVGVSSLLVALIGAFAAGLILEEVHFTRFGEKRSLHEMLNPIMTIYIPVFFVLMEIQVRLETFSRGSVLGIAAGLTAAAFIGKQVYGLAVVEKGLDRVMVELVMVPRGEVGQIMAGISKSLMCLG